MFRFQALIFFLTIGTKGSAASMGRHHCKDDEARDNNGGKGEYAKVYGSEGSCEPT